MTPSVIKPVNVSRLGSFLTDLKISWRALVLMLKSENRAVTTSQGYDSR